MSFGSRSLRRLLRSSPYFYGFFWGLFFLADLVRSVQSNALDNLSVVRSGTVVLLYCIAFIAVIAFALLLLFAFCFFFCIGAPETGNMSR
jgi:hypothetical protein